MNDSAVVILVIIGLVLLAISISLLSRQERTNAAINISVRGPEPSPHLVQAADDEKRCFILQVHGIFHRNADGTGRQRIIRSCSVGEAIKLIPEPENKFDPFAVKVCRVNGEQLGYLPADASGRNIGAISDGRWRVTIHEIYEIEERPGKFGCALRIGVLKKD